MTSILRNTNSVESDSFDLVVIGGGIYGTCMQLEAARRGWKTLLIERNDFGGATSWNSLRILHGGLRYLQSMDLGRFRSSVQEQAWWLTNFSDLVDPLPCIMPLYNRGLHRTSVMRFALKLNDWLAQPIRTGSPATTMLGNSRVISTAETQKLFPSVRPQGLKGAALWFDVRMTSPQRLLIELLRWSIAAGGQALNYVRCTGFESQDSKITAVKAQCEVTQKSLRIRTDYVANCAGPWLHDIANIALQSSTRTPGIFPDNCLAFNLILNRLPPSSHALAVSNERGTPQTYFVVPHGDRTHVGTRHLSPQADATPSTEQINAFLDDLNGAVPKWKLRPGDVEQVLAGRLPARSQGSHLPTKSPTIMHHGGRHGFENFTSVEGPKYTTARHIAHTALDQIASRRGISLEQYSSIDRPEPVDRPDLVTSDYTTLAQELQRWIQQESVIRPDDLPLRRCDIGKDVQASLTEWLTKTHPWP